MRARACLKCKEYVVIHPDNPVNIIEIKDFETKHGYHTVITVDLSEIKEDFINVKSINNKNSLKVKI